MATTVGHKAAGGLAETKRPDRWHGRGLWVVAKSGLAAAPREALRLGGAFSGSGVGGYHAVAFEGVHEIL